MTVKPKTQAGYFQAIVALFNFAVERDYMPKNPAADRYLRQMFDVERSSPREQFSIDEMNRLFRAPIYTGCVNDEHGYDKQGQNKPRRGRFWVPLLALFHGLCLNEACQLHTADVKQFDGIHYLAITKDSIVGSPSDKTPKTKSSKKDIPLHPELIKIGFLKYVEQRKADSTSRRLFPELLMKQSLRSCFFTKWFARFVEKTLGIMLKPHFTASDTKFVTPAAQQIYPTRRFRRLVHREEVSGGKGLIVDACYPRKLRATEP